MHVLRSTVCLWLLSLALARLLAVFFLSISDTVGAPTAAATMVEEVDDAVAELRRASAAAAVEAMQDEEVAAISAVAAEEKRALIACRFA